MFLSIVSILVASQASVALEVSQSEVNSRRHCTVYANGHQKDDVPNILHVFQQCGSGGTILFPQDRSYWIAQKLNPVVNDVIID